VAFCPGTLTITLTATVGDCTDTSTATLTVTGSGAATPGALTRLGGDILMGMGATMPVSTGNASWGSVKNLYR
jgi:hypothetical protein